MRMQTGSFKKMLVCFTDSPPPPPPPFSFFLRLITVFDTLMMTSAIELDTLIGQGFEQHRRPF